MGNKKPNFVKRSENGQCFVDDCSRKPAEVISFRGEFVWACREHKRADGLY